MWHLDFTWSKPFVNIFSLKWVSYTVFESCSSKSTTLSYSIESYHCPSNPLKHVLVEDANAETWPFFAFNNAIFCLFFVKEDLSTYSVFLKFTLKVIQAFNMNFTGGNHVMLFQLHWLPISYRVVLKLLLLIFKTLKTVLGFGTWSNYFNTISIPGQFVQILKTYFGSKNPILNLIVTGHFPHVPQDCGQYSFRHS